jgi:hypothetical protein
MKKFLSRFSALLLLSILALAGCHLQDELLPELERNPAITIQYEALRPSPGEPCRWEPCIVAIPKAEARLLEAAETHCGKLVIAVPCCDAGLPLMAALQYETMCAVKPLPVAPNLPIQPLASNAYGIEVRRSDCYAGGTSLDVVFRESGTPLPIGPFIFHWWIDGEYVLSNTRLECAEGDTAWLLLINTWEGDKYFFELPLHRVTEIK